MSGSRVYRARFRPRLLEDVAAGFGWYETQSVGVGDEFVQVFYSAVADATHLPLLARETYAGFRRVRLRRFPYSLYYRVEGEEVVFFLLFHGARDPGILRRTLSARLEEAEDER